MVAEHPANQQMEAQKMWPFEANTAYPICFCVPLPASYVSYGEEHLGPFVWN